MTTNTFTDRDKAIGIRQQLEGQLTENRMVKEELDLLDADAVVYKQIGPALIKQDMQEAKLAVARRLEYIQKEWCVNFSLKKIGKHFTA
jgi:prefoldin beta subunit